MNLSRRVHASAVVALPGAFALLAALGSAAATAAPGRPPSAAPSTERGSVSAGDNLRTGWYPDEPTLDPTTVGSPDFGRLFDTTLDGQIYAQPLVAGGVVLVATETNQVYALAPATGEVVWSRSLGTPWNPLDLNCRDLVPSIGVTGTPAVDATTGTAYLVAKTYVSGSSGAATWAMHALDLKTGDERVGFPVAIGGAASNAPSRVFDPLHQMQRPGLLLMNGVVYAAFGAHCDVSPYAGWVVGVSTAGAVHALRRRRPRQRFGSELPQGLTGRTLGLPGRGDDCVVLQPADQSRPGNSVERL